MCRPSDVFQIMYTKFPETIMVYTQFVAKAMSCHLASFLRGYYFILLAIQVFKAVVEHWIDIACNGRLYLSQQDSTPSHKAVYTQDLKTVILYDHITPNM